MSESSNITIRLGINGGTDSPLTYEQLDTNFLELKSVIDDYNDHINSENPHDAIFIYYDNENSSLSSSDIQSALDEVDANVVNMQNQITTKLDKTSFEDHIDSNTAHNAVDIVYDNSNSTIQQDDVNAAIDQLDANYNANDVLNKIKSVDGSGSGLDADTLDGIDSLGFDAAGAADTAVSDHVALADPHSQYADQANTYTETEVDNLLDDKADKATTYTETEVDGLLDAKAAISGQAFSGNISAPNLSGTNTGDQTKADIDALNIDAGTLDSLNSTEFVRSSASNGILSSSDDLDSITIPGHYGWNTDVPVNAPFGKYCVMIVERDGSQSIQLVYGSSSGQMAMRRANSGTYGGWTVVLTPAMAYTETEVDGLLDEKAAISGQTFTGDIAAPKITASTGVLFGTDTAAANTLDDYEEGTWTVILSDESSGGNVSVGTEVGYYTKIGRIVHLNFSFKDIKTGGMTGSNVLNVQNLPFTAISNLNLQSLPGSVYFNYVTLSGNDGGPAFDLSDGSTTGRFRFPISESQAGSIKVSDIDSGRSGIRCAITYTTD
jgi:hypothetical protein